MSPSTPSLREAAAHGTARTILTVGAGLTVASLYYVQPLLPAIGAELDMPVRTMSLMPALTQLGYMLGILFLAPLGDRADRRQLIATKTALLGLALLCAACAPGQETLLIACALIGLTATVAQDIVPAAAAIAPATQRGTTVGKVMTGLLLGILASRMFSGVVAETVGWRWVFLVASLAVAVFGMLAWVRLPSFTPSTSLSYTALLASVGTLWRSHASLRRAGLAQALLSVGFSAFWSTLAVYLHEGPLKLGPVAAGAFGLVGIVGALCAPVAGRLADRRGAEFVIRGGAGLAAVCFAAMVVATSMSPGAQLVLVAVAAIGFDLGGQAALIGHQQIVYGIDANARSRLNAALYTCMFAGIVSGSLLGGVVFNAFGWAGIALLATSTSLAGLAARVIRRPTIARPSPRPATRPSADGSLARLAIDPR